MLSLETSQHSKETCMAWVVLVTGSLKHQQACTGGPEWLCCSGQSFLNAFALQAWEKERQGMQSQLAEQQAATSRLQQEHQQAAQVRLAWAFGS